MRNNNYRSAVILCGGKGGRLGSLSKKIPKSLVNIQNYPILWFILNILKKNKFNHFILPIGYKGDQIKKFIKKKKKKKNTKEKKKKKKKIQTKKKKKKTK